MVLKGVFDAYALQQQQGQRRQQQRGINPYSRTQGMNDPRVQAMIQNMMESMGYNSLKQMPTMNQQGPMNAQQMRGNNPYHKVRPFNAQSAGSRVPGRMSPQARTPWDLDPFARQVPAYMRGTQPRGGQTSQDQLVAMAMYQHLMSHHRPLEQPRNSYRPQPSPPIINDDPASQNQAAGSWARQKPDMNEEPRVATQSDNKLGLGMENNQPDMMMDEMPRPPMGMGPNPSGRPDMMQPPPQPTPEEVQQMQKCQGVLAPKIDACLRGHNDMTVEKFMNTDFMADARGICADNIEIGKCIMGLDTACGEDEAVMTTRKMIGSVLHMMTMVCQKIETMGDGGMPPLQTQHGAPTNGLADPVEPLELPNRAREENIPGPARDDLPAFLGADDVKGEPDVLKESTFSDKVKHQEEGNKPEKDMPKPAPSAASQSQSGHDAAHPVSNGSMHVFGWPLWLVILVGACPLVVLFLIVIVCCCVRRRRQKTINIEIEKQAQPIDGKNLYTVGIPPPAYMTTAIPQTIDGLHLPPLDLNDDDGSDNDKKCNDEKPPLEASDADDESDEKEKVEEPKKKKHTADKKNKE